MAETIQVSLPADVVHDLQQAVGSDFASSDAAVAVAVREWTAQRVAAEEPEQELSAQDIQRLRQMCDEADAHGGDYLDPEEVFARLEARYHGETPAL